jgi:hypothetical protein
MTLIARSNREARAFSFTTEKARGEEPQPDMEVGTIVHACKTPATDSLNGSYASIETKFVLIGRNCYNQADTK